MTTEVLEKTIVPNESKILSVTESVTDSQKVSPVAKQINVTTCCQCGRVIGYEDYLVWYTPNSPINGRRYNKLKGLFASIVIIPTIRKILRYAYLRAAILRLLYRQR